MKNRYELKMVKKLAAIVIAFILCIASSGVASAKSLDVVGLEKVSENSSILTLPISDVSDMNVVSSDMSVVQDGDYTITCEETIYEPKDEITNILYAANGAYKMDICTSQWNVYKGATRLLFVTISSTYMHNGTYVYIEEGQDIFYQYNNAKYTNATATYTKKADKSKTQAKYVLKGTLKYGNTSKNYSFKQLFTPAGKASISPSKTKIEF